MELSYPHDQIYLAEENGMSVGVLWYQVEGMFCRYPYLHMIAVERSFRYRGYGKQLMHFYESNLAHFHQAVSLGTKLFLLVGDYNQPAQKFYQKLGYKEITQIPNLFRRGITEILMQKDLHLSALHEHAV